MPAKRRLSLLEIAGSPVCFAADDGQKVYNQLAAALANEQPVTLSFHNVTTITATFLNVAVGQLYGSFSEDQIRTLLHIEDIQPDDLALLKRVVETAKRYFKDQHILNRGTQKKPGDTNDNAHK